MSVPVKMAAAEAHWNTSDDPDFNIIAVSDKKNGENKFAISVPGMLSFMSYNTFGQSVEGINDLQEEMAANYGEGDYIPYCPGTKHRDSYITKVLLETIDNSQEQVLCLQLKNGQYRTLMYVECYLVTPDFMALHKKRVKNSCSF